MKLHIYFFIVVTLLFKGCDINNITDYSNSYDYSIEQKMDCFCPQAGEWVKLFVKADTVSGALRMSSNQILDYKESKYYKSVKGLFDLISNTDTSSHELMVTYNPEYSFPSYIYVDLKPIVVDDSTTLDVADAQYSYTTENFKTNEK